MGEELAQAREWPCVQGCRQLPECLGVPPAARAARPVSAAPPRLYTIIQYYFYAINYRVMLVFAFGLRRLVRRL